MSQTSNKEIEQYCFEKFRKAYPLPNGCITYGDKPDVIIEGPRKIGIEITRFFIENGNLLESEQNQRKVRKDVIRRAHKIYLDEGRKPIEITFEFNKNNPIRNNQKLITKIVELGRRLETNKTGIISRSLFDDIPELDFVYVNATVYINTEWRIVQTYTGSIMSREKLAEIVREKEQNARDYQKCDAYWLLIVVDFMDRAQDQAIWPEGLVEQIKSEIFKKIIVYRTGFDPLEI
jgi:hypothetical protein